MHLFLPSENGGGKKAHNSPHPMIYITHYMYVPYLRQPVFQTRRPIKPILSYYCIFRSNRFYATDIRRMPPRHPFLTLLVDVRRHRAPVVAAQTRDRPQIEIPTSQSNGKASASGAGAEPPRRDAGATSGLRCYNNGCTLGVPN